MPLFSPAHPHIQYIGRIDHQLPEAPVFYWAGSNLLCRFTGESLSVTLQNHRSYSGLLLGYVLDGTEGVLTLSETTEPQTVSVPVTGKGAHRFQLFKRQDATHFVTILGLTLAEGGELLPPPPLPSRRIECYGDSVSAGSVCEAYTQVGQHDPPVYDATLDNAWHGYAMQTARLLQAQIHLVAQGGIALLDHTGYYDNGTIGMETAYRQLAYLPFAPTSDWDFTRYQPQVVLFAIGQNDHHVGDEDLQTFSPAQREQWLTRYCALLTDLLERYPTATFVLLLTVLMHDPYWDALLDEAQQRLQEPRILRFRFRRCGTATPGHPRVPEQCEMACELTEFLLAQGEQIWA